MGGNAENSGKPQFSIMICRLIFIPLFYLNSIYIFLEGKSVQLMEDPMKEAIKIGMGHKTFQKAKKG